MKRAWLVLWCWGVLGMQAQEPSSIAIRNAKVHTVSGGVLAKGTVLVKNGLIEAVGENITIPADAWVIDGEGMNVYPGMIDSMSAVGIDAPPALAGGFGGRGGGLAMPPTAATQPAAPAARGPEDRPRTFSWERAADK
ncbi:MAG: amidohydrolase, partial [Bryobacteraceae bacterium]|nr:amidohydrolase [Bryobacteraceae bacterium]